MEKPSRERHRHLILLYTICWGILTAQRSEISSKALEDFVQHLESEESVAAKIAEQAETLLLLASLGSFGQQLGLPESKCGLGRPRLDGRWDPTTTPPIQVAPTMGESGKALLPKSRPWNAPEHHFGELEVQEAKRMDVHSFGMLCFWFLFGNRLSDTQTTEDGTPELISFNVPLVGHRTLLGRLMKIEWKILPIVLWGQCQA